MRSKRPHRTRREELECINSLGLEPATREASPAPAPLPLAPVALLKEWFKRDLAKINSNIRLHELRAQGKAHEQRQRKAHEQRREYRGRRLDTLYTDRATTNNEIGGQDADEVCMDADEMCMPIQWHQPTCEHTQAIAAYMYAHLPDSTKAIAAYQS